MAALPRRYPKADKPRKTKTPNIRAPALLFTDIYLSFFIGSQKGYAFFNVGR
jgi:hypothetical protein